MSASMVHPCQAQEAASPEVNEPQLVVRHTFLSVVGSAPKGKYRKARTDSELHAGPCALDFEAAAGSDAETAVPDDSRRVTPSSECPCNELCAADEAAEVAAEAQEQVSAGSLVVVRHTFLHQKGDSPAGKYRKARTDSELHCPCEEQYELGAAGVGAGAGAEEDTQECTAFCATPSTMCWRERDARAGLPGVDAFGMPAADCACPAAASASEALSGSLVVKHTFLDLAGAAPRGRLRKARTDSELLAPSGSEAYELGPVQEESGELACTPEPGPTPRDIAATGDADACPGASSLPSPGGAAAAPPSPPSARQAQGQDRAVEAAAGQHVAVVPGYGIAAPQGVILLQQAVWPASEELQRADSLGSGSASSSGPVRIPPRPAPAERRANESLGGRRKGEKPRPRGDARTTVMMRNIPNNYSREMLLELLDEEGFNGQYDFAYLPIDFASGAGLGYAFVNLVDAGLVAHFWRVFDGFCNWRLPTSKVCELSWSKPYQGLRANVLRYKNSSVMHPSVSDEHKPCVFVNGARAPFPKPTRALRPPTP